MAVRDNKKILESSLQAQVACKVMRLAYVKVLFLVKNVTRKEEVDQKIANYLQFQEGE